MQFAECKVPTVISSSSNPLPCSVHVGFHPYDGLIVQFGDDFDDNDNETQRRFYTTTMQFYHVTTYLCNNRNRDPSSSSSQMIRLSRFVRTMTFGVECLPELLLKQCSMPTIVRRIKPIGIKYIKSDDTLIIKTLPVTDAPPLNQSIISRAQWTFNCWHTDGDDIESPSIAAKTYHFVDGNDFNVQFFHDTREPSFPIWLICVRRFSEMIEQKQKKEYVK